MAMGAEPVTGREDGMLNIRHFDMIGDSLRGSLYGAGAGPVCTGTCSCTIQVMYANRSGVPVITNQAAQQAIAFGQGVEYTLVQLEDFV